MGVAEIKKTLMEKVERLTEEQLVEVNRFVDAIDKDPASEYNLLPHIENIVKERDEVLKKLAE